MPEAAVIKSLLPQLLRALWVGHPSHRGRVVRLLATLDDVTLSQDPARETFLRLIDGDSLDVFKRVGDLVSRRGLTIYGEALVEQLKGDEERRQAADGFLRKRALPRPVAALVKLARDGQASLEARTAALELLREVELDSAQRRALIDVLADEALHGPALKILAPLADDALVATAVQKNREYGWSLLRLRGHRVNWLANLLGGGMPRGGHLGQFFNLRRQQLPFVRAIVELAIVAEAKEWLIGALTPLIDRELGLDLAERLKDALVRLEVREIADELEAWVTEEGTALGIELLGLLGEGPDSGTISAYLPEHGRNASAAHQAAILALARRGNKKTIGPYLDGVLVGVKRELGQKTEGSMAHRSIWRVGFQAGAAAHDERFAALALEMLAGDRDVDEVDPILNEVLVALDPLELVPTVTKVLEAKHARAAARREALDVVRDKQLTDLLPQVVALATRELGVADRVTRLLAKLLTQDHTAHARALIESARIADEPCKVLLTRCTEVLGERDAIGLARLILERGAGGPRAQERALAYLGEQEEPAAFLETCLQLFRSPHGAVRTSALKAALARGLLEPPAEGQPLRADAIAYDLLRMVRDALVSHEADGAAKRQVTLLLDALVPKAGVPGFLDGEAADELRARVRRIGLWTEQATFHAMHRELLVLEQRGLDLSIFHGAVLLLLAEKSFFHPLFNTTGPYKGPLPRYPEAAASPSPFVQEALFEVVCAPAYLRTDKLLVSFLTSPRERVRRLALGELNREAVLNHAAAVLERLTDDAPSVRRACVDLLRKHDLARFSSDLWPLLEDTDDGVRLQAARTLAGWGDLKCLAQLSGFLASDDVKLRKEAITYLRRFEPSQLGGLLAAHVTLETPRAAAAVLAALRPDRLPDDDALGDAVFLLAAQGSGPLRARALRFLPALAAPQRLGEVVPLLSDPLPQVRAAAGYVLRRRDGRKHAAAIAELAASTPDTDMRLEILGLLADLGVPEAGRGLLPLLLDDDPQVRARARTSVVAMRGFSPQQELVALLQEALNNSASEAAIEELVRLLDQTGDEEVLTPLAEALRCEDRAVWEAVVAAARARKSDRLRQPLTDALDHDPPLPSALVTLALQELGRTEAWREGGARQRILRLAKQAPAETIQRKALELTAVMEEPREDAVGLAAAWAKTTLKRIEELEKLQQEAKQDKKRKNKKKKAEGKDDPRAELARLRGTLTTCVRIQLAAAARDGAPALIKAVKQVPAAAIRGKEIPGAILRFAANAVLADASADIEALVKPLLKYLPRGRVAAPYAVASMVRDHLSTTDYLGRAKGIEKQVRALDLVTARFLNDQVDAASHTKLLDRKRDDYGQLEAFTLSCMEHWKTELRPLLTPIAQNAVEAIKDKPDDRWGGKARESQGLAEKYAYLKLRLELSEAREQVLALATDDEFKQRFLAAEGDVAGLQAALVALKGETTTKQRGQVLELLGEVGEGAAVEALAAWEDPDPRARDAQACALGVLHAKEHENPKVLEALGRLLDDEEGRVQTAAVEAAAKLGARSHSAKVLRILAAETSSAEATAAACNAARRLELGEARPLLHPHLAASGKPGQAAAWALVELADESSIGPLLEALKAGTRKQLGLLERALIRVVPDGRLDEVGALLGDAKPLVVSSALRILAERKHAQALDGVRDLLAHTDGKIRLAAVRAIGKYADPSLVPDLLLRIDGKTEKDNGVRAAALETAAALMSDPAEARKLLLERAQDTNLRRVALKALGSLPADPDTTGLLLKVIQEALYPDVALLDEGEELEALDRRLQGQDAEGPDRDVRMYMESALRALIKLGDERALGQALRFLWAAVEERWANNDHFKTLRVWLKEGEPGRDVVPRLLAVAESSWSMKENALSEAARIDPGRAAPTLLAQLRDSYRPGEKEKLRVLRAIVTAYRAGETHWLGTLRGYLLDAHHAVRLAAREALDPERRPAKTQDEEA